MITLLYSGNVGIGQDVGTVLRATARLNCNGDLRTLIVGSGKGLAATRDLVSQLQLHNIEFREPVPLYRLAELLVMGDIHVIFQKPGTEGLLVPSKIYGVLAAGRPSLFLGPLHSEVGQIICESRSGFVIEAGDVEGTTNALATLINSPALRQEMGHNAREYYKQHFGRQRSVSKIIDIVERVAGWTVKEKDNPIIGQPLQERKISRMANDRRNRGSFFAAIAASLLVFALGLSYRALSGQLFSPTTGTLIGPSALERFPVQINGWMGQDVPLDDSVLSAIGAEACINRCYSRGNRLESVSLFIAASGTRRDALVGHPPELCNVMAGWTLMNCSSTELPLGGETKLPCSIFEFSQNGSLDGAKRVVLSYYMADGQYWGSRLALRSSMRRRSGPVNYVAQVQIAASKDLLTADSAMKLVCAFAVDSASDVARLFEKVDEDPGSDEFTRVREGK